MREDASERASRQKLKELTPDDQLMIKVEVVEGGDKGQASSDQNLKSCGAKYV